MPSKYLLLLIAFLAIPSFAAASASDQERCRTNYVDQEDPIIRQVCVTTSFNAKQVRLVRTAGSDIILTEIASRSVDRMKMKLDARSAKEFKKESIFVDWHHFTEDGAGVLEYSGKLQKGLEFGWYEVFQLH